MVKVPKKPVAKKPSASVLVADSPETAAPSYDGLLESPVPANKKKKRVPEELVATSPEELVAAPATPEPNTKAARKSKAAATAAALTDKETKLAHNNMRTYLTRVGSGQLTRANEEQRADATKALEHYDGLAKDKKDAFIKIFLDNKKTKDFGFIKQYMEEMTASTRFQETVTEKFMTRTCTL